MGGIVGLGALLAKNLCQPRTKVTTLARKEKLLSRCDFDCLLGFPQATLRPGKRRENSEISIATTS